MDLPTRRLLDKVNLAVIRLRGAYSAWSKNHGILYNEMLVLYTIRDHGYCTQKQVCDNYLLPRQTINHVITDLRNRGLLALSPENSTGREKAFVLTEKGKAYAQPLLDSLTSTEEQAMEHLGLETVRIMAESLDAYTAALFCAMEKDAQQDISSNHPKKTKQKEHHHEPDRYTKR